MTRSARILIPVVLVVAAIVLGATAAPARSGARSVKDLSTLSHRVALAINKFRVAHGLNALNISTDLNASSQQHSEEMGADGYFAHPSANGTAFWKRIQQYYSSSNYDYWTVGENLLWSAPNVGVGTAMKMWIASPEHLQNLLDKDWVDLGVSAVHVVHAGGVYHGSTVTIITTDFGARR